jgi:hypothetical protein
LLVFISPPLTLLLLFPSLAIVVLHPFHLSLVDYTHFHPPTTTLAQWKRNQIKSTLSVSLSLSSSLFSFCLS